MVIISAATVSTGSTIAHASATPMPCMPALTGTDLYTKLGPELKSSYQQSCFFTQVPKIIMCAKKKFIIHSCPLKQLLKITLQPVPVPVSRRHVVHQYQSLCERIQIIYDN